MFKRIDTLKVKGIAISLLLFHHLFYSTARIEANGVVFHIFVNVKPSAFLSDEFYGTLEKMQKTN